MFVPKCFAASTTSAVSIASTASTKVAEPTSSKSAKTKTEIKKLDYKDTDYNELLGDKGNTLFTEDQIKKQNERLKESQKFLESI